MLIGYYAHHQGAGHLKRARQIAATLRSRGAEVVLLTSVETGDDESTHLPLDHDGEATRPGDPSANGRLHWAPHAHGGLRARARIIADLVDDRRPDAFVSDVSVEVAGLVRLMGVPLVTVALPGDRSDDVHRWGYGISDAVLAPWSDRLYRPGWLEEHAPRVHYTGGFGSRHRTLDRRVPSGSGRRALLVSGAGGSSIDVAAYAALRRRTPTWSWERVGADRWVDDLTACAERADVVVASAGMGAVSDLAHWGLPSILLAEDRAYGEQQVTADVLRHAGMALSAADLDSVDEELLERARTEPLSWAGWSDPAAVEVACDVIVGVGGR